MVKIFNSWEMHGENRKHDDWCLHLVEFLLLVGDKNRLPGLAQPLEIEHDVLLPNLTYYIHGKYMNYILGDYGTIYPCLDLREIKNRISSLEQRI